MGGRPLFPPVVRAHRVKLACELPQAARRSLSLWPCAELARTLERDAVVESISPQTVQRWLSAHRLKPWRVHYWLSPKTPRDEEFYRRVEDLCDLYTRPLEPYERVLCTDEKTSLQPRPRTAPTRPARPDGVPVRLEHEYSRAGALNLIAAFDTRSGEVVGICRRRKRQVEFIELLEEIDRRTPAAITIIHMVCDNVSVHHAKNVRAWLAQHPRFQFHFTPVHCSWTNQIEQWFSILQRKRFRYADFANLQALEAAILQFIVEWKEIAHPFHWTRASFNKVLPQADDATKAAA